MQSSVGGHWNADGEDRSAAHHRPLGQNVQLLK